MIICDQSETGLAMGAIGDYIHEIGCFCGCKEQNDNAVHKIGPFYGCGSGKQKETPSKGCLMKCYRNKALQRRVIRVSEMFVEHRSSGDARPEQSEWSVCP